MDIFAKIRLFVSIDTMHFLCLTVQYILTIAFRLFMLVYRYVDHVPVKADLSDLEDQIRWCRNNDDKCREIGQNAMKFYEKYVSRSALLDYVEMACKQMAKRYVSPPEWFENPTPECPPPNLRKPDTKCFEDKKTHQSKYCKRCQQEADAEEREKAETERKRKAEKTDTTKAKLSYRERMKKKAKLAADKTADKKVKGK